MVRSPDRRAIFGDDRDREDLLECLATLARGRQLAVYAWALMSNHFHLLVATPNVPLECSMHSLLRSFAAVLSQRREGAGELVPDCYESAGCEAERHFLEVIRYIHLNPLRGGIVRHVDELDDYPYTGHSALLSTVPRDWQSTQEVLERFGRSTGWARAAYRKFVCEGVLTGGTRRRRRRG
jgi:REP element-mobilizing transposase RayT